METSREQTPGKPGFPVYSNSTWRVNTVPSLCSTREYRKKTRNPWSSDWSIQKPASFLADKMSRVQIRRKGLLETTLEKNPASSEPPSSEVSLVGVSSQQGEIGKQSNNHTSGNS